MMLLTNSYVSKNEKLEKYFLKLNVKQIITLKIQLIGKLMASFIPKKCTNDQRTVAMKFITTTKRKKCEDPL